MDESCGPTVPLPSTDFLNIKDLGAQDEISSCSSTNNDESSGSTVPLPSTDFIHKDLLDLDQTSPSPSTTEDCSRHQDVLSEESASDECISEEEMSTEKPRVKKSNGKKGKRAKVAGEKVKMKFNNQKRARTYKFKKDWLKDPKFEGWLSKSKKKKDNTTWLIVCGVTRTWTRLEKPSENTLAVRVTRRVQGLSRALRIFQGPGFHMQRE